jgi:hypothetical protein
MVSILSMLEQIPSNNGQFLEAASKIWVEEEDYETTLEKLYSNTNSEVESQIDELKSAIYLLQEEVDRRIALLVDAKEQITKEVEMLQSEEREKQEDYEKNKPTSRRLRQTPKSPSPSKNVRVLHSLV